MNLEKNINITNLLEIYKNLLTEHQVAVLTSYYLHNFSYGEIAENLHISRQAVKDVITRSEKILINLDNKLGLIEKRDKILGITKGKLCKKDYGILIDLLYNKN